jgi:hypothetical protein
LVKNKRAKQLGMPFGTACNRLRKSIMFSLIQETKKDNCYRCGNKIERDTDLSIEHPTSWLDSEDPKGLFWSLENIAFSHLSCNSGASVSPLKGKLKHPSLSAYKKGCRCNECVKVKSNDWIRYSNKYGLTKKGRTKTSNK